MKKWIFFIVLFTIPFASCKDDDDPEPEIPRTPYDDIIGTYRNIDLASEDLAFFIEYDAQKQKLLFFMDCYEEPFIPAVKFISEGSYLLTGEYEGDDGVTGWYSISAAHGKLTLKSDKTKKELVAIFRTTERDLGYAIEGDYLGVSTAEDGELRPATAVIDRTAKNQISVRINGVVFAASVEADFEEEIYVFKGIGIEGRNDGKIYIEYVSNGKKYSFSTVYKFV